MQQSLICWFRSCQLACCLMILRGTILEPCRLQRKQTIRETLSVPLSCVSYVSGATSAQTPNPAVASPCLFMWFCLMHCHKASSIAPCDCMFVLLPSGSRKRVLRAGTTQSRPLRSDREISQASSLSVLPLDTRKLTFSFLVAKFVDLCLVSVELYLTMATMERSKIW